MLQMVLYFSKCKRQFALLVILVLFPFSIFAQENLVVDPSFEDNKELPESTGQGGFCLKYWSNPNSGHFDYYNKNALKNTAGVPDNKFGSQEPHSGAAYAGICIQSNYREFALSKLKEPLKKNQKYCISLYISKAEAFRSYITSFSVLFSELPWDLKQVPQIKFEEKNGYQDEQNWICLFQQYKAKGNETVIIAGYFGENYIPGLNTHYYIDDVSVIPIDKENCDCSLFVNDQNISEAKEDSSLEVASIPDSIPDQSTKYESLNVGEVITLKNIYFEIESSKLKPESFTSLDLLVDFLKRNMSVFIEISGHTDNTGLAEKNIKLSEMRAKAVTDYLIDKGIEKERLTYNGLGSTRPIADNSSETGREQNRRVEFRIVKK